MAELVERTQPRYRRLKPVEFGAAPSPTSCGSRWICAWRPPPPRSWARTSPTIRTIARRPSTGTARPQRVLTLERIDGIPIGDRDAIIAAGHDPDVVMKQVRRGVLLPGVPRRLLPCRHAWRQRLRRSRGPHRAGRFRHHGPHRRGHARLSRRAAGRLPAPRLPRRGRGAVPRGLRAVRPVARDVRPGLPLDRRADLRQAQPRDLDRPPAGAPAARHRAVRDDGAAAAPAAAEDHADGRGHGHAAQSATSTSGSWRGP